MANDVASLIRSTSERLGIDPVDLGTAISYESAGTFDPKVQGPTTKWGQHIGLIQMGETQRKEYGITPDSPLPDQFNAIERYLRDRGVRPGMGLLDIYSTINAGRPGRYSASDAAAGGAPGTVADKVRSMAAHRMRAQLLLNGKIDAAAAAPRVTTTAAQASGGSAPLSLAPEGEDADMSGFAALLEAARRYAASAQDNDLPDALPPLQVGPLQMRMGRRRA